MTSHGIRTIRVFPCKSTGQLSETGGPETLGRPGAGDPSVQFYPPFLCNFKFHSAANSWCIFLWVTARRLRTIPEQTPLPLYVYGAFLCQLAITCRPRS